MARTIRENTGCESNAFLGQCLCVTAVRGIDTDRQHVEYDTSIVATSPSTAQVPRSVSTSYAVREEWQRTHR